MTRRALGTDDGGDDAAGPGGLADNGLRKYEEDESRRAVVREAKMIARDAVRPDKPPRPDPRSLPPAERRRATGRNADRVEAGSAYCPMRYAPSTVRDR